MLQTLKRLSKMVAGYGMVQWAGPFLSFIFTPIITRILNPSDYGIADYIGTVSSAVGTIASLALPQVLVAHFNDQQDAEWQRCVTGSAFAIALTSGLVFGFAMFILAPVLAGLSPIATDYARLFRISGIALVFGLCSAALSSAAQAALRVRWGMVLSITQILATVIGNVVFIIILRWGVTGMVLVPSVMGLAMFVVGLFLTRRLIGKPSLSAVRLLLRTGVVLLPAGLAGWGLQVADRLFLAQYVSAESLGHYAIANKIATLLYVAIGPIFTAYTPLALAMQRDALAKERYAIMARYLISIVLFAGLGLGLYATELLTVFTRTAYLPAAPYVGFLAYVHIFGAINTILYTGGLAGKEFEGITWTVLLGAAVNLVLNILLIPRFQIWGATFATLIGYAVPPASLYLWLKTRYPVPYPIGIIMSAIAIQFGLLLLGLLVPPVAFLLRAGIKFLILISLLISFVVTRMITPAEIGLAVTIMRGWWQRHIHHPGGQHAT